MALDLTVGGRLEVAPFVTERKLGWMSEKLTQALSGSERARLDVTESISTSDALFTFAHLANMKNIPEYDKAERKGSLIAQRFEVDDFDTAVWEGFEMNFDKLKHGKDVDGRGGIAPKVAEGDTYPNALTWTSKTLDVELEKRGFKVPFTLERMLRNPSHWLRNVPTAILEVQADTEEFLIFRALQRATAASGIKAGTETVSGESVTVNPVISLAAMRLGLQQIARRVDAASGRKIPLAREYYVVVEQGMGETVEIELAKNRALVGVTDGLQKYDGRQLSQLGNLGKIKGVIESEFVEEGFWALVPAAGSTRRPSLLDLRLTGRTAPELLVSNFNGTLLKGGNGSSPFDLAHFDNDTIDLKSRQFVNSALLTDDQIAWSNSTGA